MSLVPRESPWSPGRALGVVLLVPWLAFACGTGDGTLDPGTGGAKATGGTTAGTTGGTGSGGQAGQAGKTGTATGGSGTGGSGTGGSATGGAKATGGNGPVTGGKGGTPAATGGTGNATGTGGAKGGSTGTRDHCIYGFDPQPSDETMKDGPNEFYPPNKSDPAIVDLTVQPEVMKWMTDNGWQGGHVEWHAIRTCKLSNGTTNGATHVDICHNPKAPPIPADQNCQSEGDGYQFLLFHRHMMEALRQLWPKHTEQFTGFPKFPASAADVPKQWQAAWTPFGTAGMKAGMIGDNIDKPENLAMFPNEGALGFYLQCQVGQMLKMSNGQTLRSDGIHFDLHNHWVRTGNTTHGVGNTNVNIENYMFWKLHGWIDTVWEKYRTAKGLTRKDQKYIKDMQDSCHEMDVESALSVGKTPPPLTDPLPAESGYFHTMVRPIFESMTNKCSGCHDVGGPEAGMSLGGHISSAEIVAGLVDMPTAGGGQYKRVVPGKPMESWLYLKILGMTGTCKPTGDGRPCYPSVMPPDSDMKVTVTPAEADIIKKWITDGAPAPTSP